MTTICQMTNEKYGIKFELRKIDEEYVIYASIGKRTKYYPVGKNAKTAYAEFEEDFHRCVASQRYRQEWWF